MVVDSLEDDEDRDYMRLLGKSSSTKGAARSSLSFTADSPKQTSKSPAGGRTPVSSVKVALDDIEHDCAELDVHNRSPRNIPPGAPGYIEPGSTPDKSVHDKIRLFHQRSATGQPKGNKELFGAGGQVQKAKAGLTKEKQDDGAGASASKPPKPRQVEQLVLQSQAESMIRKRGVRDLKNRGKFADGMDHDTAGQSGKTAEYTGDKTSGPSQEVADEREGPVRGAERIVASPRPPTWMCRVVVTAVEARDVPRIQGEAMTDFACRVTLNGPDALPVTSTTKMVRSSGHDRGVKWKERMVFGLQEDLATFASLDVELVGRSVANPSQQVTFGHVRELRVSELLNQAWLAGWFEIKDEKNSLVGSTALRLTIGFQKRGDSDDATPSLSSIAYSPTPSSLSLADADLVEGPESDTSMENGTPKSALKGGAGGIDLSTTQFSSRRGARTPLALHKVENMLSGEDKSVSKLQSFVQVENADESLGTSTRAARERDGGKGGGDRETLAENARKRIKGNESSCDVSNTKSIGNDVSVNCTSNDKNSLLESASVVPSKTPAHADEEHTTTTKTAHSDDDRNVKANREDAPADYSKAESAKEQGAGSVSAEPSRVRGGGAAHNPRRRIGGDSSDDDDDYKRNKPSAPPTASAVAAATHSAAAAQITVTGKTSQKSARDEIYPIK